MYRFLIYICDQACQLKIFSPVLKYFIDIKKKVLYIAFIVNADIAQLVEQLICNQWVGSSSLSVGTIKKTRLYGGFFNGISFVT